MQSDKTISPAYVIVVGASAGGLNALTELVGQLRDDMDIAVFIVLHLSTSGIGNYLVQRLQLNTSLLCKEAEHDEKINKGRIYIAPPNQHLIVKESNIIIGHGALENRWRPSIDVLFRSAAVAFNSRAIGIILTGLLNDGTAGMIAIKKCGGICIVQDPNEAEYPNMPLAVLNSVEVDYSISLMEIGNVIAKIVKRPLPQKFDVPDDIRAESEIAERVSTDIGTVKTLGNHSVYTCPDCGGNLWEIVEGNFHRYRCYVGHSYSEDDLVMRQGENTEAALWVALRMMEERRNLLKKLVADSKRKGFARMALDYDKKAMEMEGHINRLKEILFFAQTTER